MPITISGVASGLDTDGIVNQLMSLEQRPIILLQRQIARSTARLTAVTALGGNIGAVGVGAGRIGDDLFNKSKLSVSDETILSATDNGNAAVGTYSVEVKQLARAHRLSSSGFADKDSTGVAAGSGTFTWKIGTAGTAQSVSVSATTTLQDLADSINALSGGGLVATIINDTTSSNPFRLVLTSSTTGTASDISITNNDTTLDLANKQIDSAEVGGANAGTYTGTVTSSGTYTGTGNKTFLLEIISTGNADTATYKFSIDGGLTFDDNGGAGYTAASAATAIGGNTDGVNIEFSDDGSDLTVGDRFSVDVFDPALQSSRDAVAIVDGITAVTQTNSVTDVIGGVTLMLLEAEVGTTVKVTIARDFEKLSAELNGMVVSLNNVAKFVNDQSKYDVDTKRAGILSGDAAVRGMYRTLRNALAAINPATKGTAYDSLMSIGLTSSSKGAFTFDKGVFEAAIADDATLVQRLLKDFGQTSTSKIQYQSQTEDTKAGTYIIKIVDDGEGGKTVTIGGHSVKLVDDVATGIKGTKIEGLTIKIKDLQDQSLGQFGTIEISKGIIDNVSRTVAKMNDSRSGIIKGKTDAINSHIKSLNEQIADHKLRLVSVERRLRRQFTDLEIIMGRLSSQQDFITQQINQWNKQRR